VIVSTTLTSLSLKGQLYYDYINKTQRFDSDLFNVQQSELDIFSNYTRYVWDTNSNSPDNDCQKCALSSPLLPLFVEDHSSYVNSIKYEGAEVDVWTLVNPIFDLTMTWYVDPYTPALVVANFTVGDVSTWLEFSNLVDTFPPASTFLPPAQCGPLTCNSPADMIFVLDGSGSIGYGDFNVAKQFLIDLVSSFTISPSETNVGVIQFSVSPVIEVSLSSSDTDVMATLKALTEENGGSTDLAAAIRTATNMLVSSPRSGVPKIMVLLTDGYTSPSPVNDANAAKEQGIEIFCVAIGSADEYVLQSIASTPTVNHFFEASQFDQLQTLLDSVVANTCSNYDCDASAPKALEPFHSLWSRVLMDK
jgi:hypothetical protein